MSKRIKTSADNAGCLLLSLDKTILTGIFSWLWPADYVNVGRSCGRFGLTQVASRTSLVNEIAEVVFRHSASGDEVHALPRYDHESFIALLHQLNLLRQPLAFDWLVGYCIDYVPNGSKSSVWSSTEDYNGSYKWSTAFSNFKMRCGKHYATFRIQHGGMICLGVVRPLIGCVDKDLLEFDPTAVDSSDSHSNVLLAQHTRRWGDSIIHCCGINCYDGYCQWSTWTKCYNTNWEGREKLPTMCGTEFHTIGLLLDLDNGTLAVDCNGKHLGEMIDDLEGEYCWFTTVLAPGCLVSIERGT